MSAETRGTAVFHAPTPELDPHRCSGAFHALPLRSAKGRDTRAAILLGL